THPRAPHRCATSSEAKARTGHGCNNRWIVWDKTSRTPYVCKCVDSMNEAKNGEERTADDEPDRCHTRDSFRGLTRIRRHSAIYFLLHRGNIPKKAAGWQAPSWLFELALVLALLDHVVSVIVNANHGIEN